MERETITVQKVEKDTELAKKLLGFVEAFPWLEVREHTAAVIRDWAFEGWEAPFAAMAGGRIVGGALISVDAERGEGSLDTIYVMDGAQGRGIGRALWETIESSHPEITIWRTCTPYFDKRNIHFYINVCGFHAVRFCDDRLKDSDGDGWEDDGLGEFFDFEKREPPRTRGEDGSV